MLLDVNSKDMKEKKKKKKKMMMMIYLEES